MGTVLTLRELTANYVGSCSVIIMTKAVNNKCRVLRMGDANFSKKIREPPGETHFELSLGQ